MSNEKYILACINGFRPSDAVTDYSAWFAKANAAELKLFYALDHQFQESNSDLSGSIGLGEKDELLAKIVEIEFEQNKLIQEKGHLILESAKRRASNFNITEPNLCLRRGRFINNVLDFQSEISMAVIGRFGQRHQNQVEDHPIGHKVEALVRSLKKPILIVSEDYTEPKSLLLGFDGSEGSYKALNFIKDKKGFSALEIHLVYVGEKNEKSDLFLADAEKILAGQKLNFKLTVLDGAVETALEEYLLKFDIDILAMGAFGHNWLHDLIVGSLTSKMLNMAHKPLLLLR